MSLLDGLIRLRVVTRAARPGLWSFLLSLLRHQRIFPSRRVSMHRHVGLPRGKTKNNVFPGVSLSLSLFLRVLLEGEFV